MRWAIFAAAFILSFVLSIDFFLPKDRVAALFMGELAKSGVEVLQIDEKGGYSIRSNALNLEAKGVLADSYIYLARLHIDSLGVESMPDFKIENIELRNSPFSPKSFDFSAKSRFGAIEGVIDASNKQAHIEIIANKEFENIKPTLSALAKTTLNKTEKGYSVDFSY
ncbi:MAG TPA: hypothetical protein PLV58_07895 [Campylobacterales bacterium]|nr:hypothetical protein [Campylobacterales bacterium]